MNKSKLIRFVIVSYLLCVSFANAKLFDAKEFFLENGMRVVVVPNHKAPIVKHMVWYMAGGADDKLGKAGTAHLLEHLMFRGTGKIKDGEINTILAEHGADSNAFTSYDVTAYHQMLDISRLELAMFLEADRMQNLKLTQDGFDKEQAIVFQERKQTVENNPMAYFGEKFRHNLWGTHQYGRPVIGLAEEIMGLELQDVKDFYKRFYAPNNAILILSGDIDVETAKVLAEKYYGRVERREVGKKAEFVALNDKKEMRFEMSLPQINARRFVKSYITEASGTDKKDIYVMSILASYLGDGETSELYKDLVLDKKAALSVSVSYNPSSRSYSTFTISAVPAEGVSEQKFEKLLDEAILGAQKRFNSDKLEEIKTKNLAGLVYLRDNPSDAAYILGYMLATGYSLEEIENQEELIRKVEYEDVIRVADGLFYGKGISQVGWLKPEEK